MGYPFHIYKLCYSFALNQNEEQREWYHRFDWEDIEVCALAFLSDLFLYPVPDFCISTASPPSSTLHPPIPPPSCRLLPLLDLWQNPVIEGVFVCVSVSVCVCRGVHLGVSFAAAATPHPPCQCVSPRWPWLTGRGGRGSAACCHMRESAYIQCLWIKTGKYRLKKIQECLLGGWWAECSKPLPGSSLFHFSVLRRRHSHPQSQLWMTGESVNEGGSSQCGVLKIHHRLTGRH